MKLTTILSTLLLSCSSYAADKPNILLFFIDDLGWADVGANGSTFHETPHIDRLAKEGVNFSNGYSAHPVCSPTRSALMSGKAPQRVGITQWIHQPSDIHLPLSEVTIAEALAEGGYSTGYIGKWHLGEKDHQLPTGHGYQWMKSVNRAGQPASYFHPYKRKSKRGSFWDVPDLENGKEGDYLTDKITDHAIDFITLNKDKPFFLTFSHYTVHTPIQAPKKLIEKYQAKRTKMYGDEKAAALPGRYNTKSRARQDNPAYAAMLESLDNSVGRVIAHLEELELLDNTLVIFTSDNGGHCNNRSAGVTSNQPLRSGKGWNYEGGIRIPTIFYWKGKLSARSVDTPAITMDIYPTLLDLAGLPLKPEQHLDGQSLVPALHGKESESLDQRFLAWSYPHNHGSGHKPSNAIRQGNWKLIRFDSGQRYELYNLKKDLAENNDLSKTFPEKAKMLDRSLTQWLAETYPKKDQ